MSELLRRAAARIEANAAAFARGPRWDYGQFSDDEPWTVLERVPADEWVDEDSPPVLLVSECDGSAAAAWAALLDPGVAAPLAAWLRAEADSCEVLASKGFTVRSPWAAAFARAVLREES